MNGTIREAVPSDANSVLAIYAPIVERTAISFEAVPPSVEEMGARIGEANRSLAWLVFEEGGTVRGYAYASRHKERAAYRWSAEVAVYLHPDARRRGVGTALYRSLLALLHLLGLHNAVALIALPNPASVGLHESLGFRRVALYRSIGYKLGAWRDVGHWQLSLRPSEGEPAPLLRPEDLRGTPDWEAAVASGRGWNGPQAM